MGRSGSCDPRARPHELPRKSGRDRRPAVRLRPDRRRHRPVRLRSRTPTGCPPTASPSRGGATTTRCTARGRPFSASSTPTASRSTTRSGPTPCSNPSRRPKRSRRTSTSATACSSTRTGELRAGRHRPTEPTSRPRRRKRSIARSSRSSGGTPTYVAKALWRGEVVFAKFALDYDAKFVALRRVLEWRIELDHDWSLRPGAYGRGLERLLPADISAELASTYVGTGIEENWDALFRTTALFRRVATEVGRRARLRVSRRRRRGRQRAPRRRPPARFTARKAVADHATTRARSRRSSGLGNRRPAAPAPRKRSAGPSGSTRRSPCLRGARAAPAPGSPTGTRAAGRAAGSERLRCDPGEDRTERRPFRRTPAPSGRPGRRGSSSPSRPRSSSRAMSSTAPGTPAAPC